MKPFLFSLLLLRQKLDERIAAERARPRGDWADLRSLERRKQALARKVNLALHRQLLAGA